MFGKCGHFFLQSYVVETWVWMREVSAADEVWREWMLEVLLVMLVKLLLVVVVGFEDGTVAVVDVIT